MTLIETVFDLPVLLQGVLGSFLFLVIYQLAKRITGLILRMLGKFNKQVRRELKIVQFFHHASSAFADETNNRPLILGIFMAVNRLVHGLIFICFGAISSFYLGPISIVAYVIAVAYLFLALRAVHIDLGPASPVEIHEKEMMRLASELLPAKNTSANKNGVE